jgi:hypothetical protein
VTPDAPFDVSIATAEQRQLLPQVSSMLSACATNSAAIVR